MEHILNLREFQYISSMICWDLVLDIALSHPFTSPDSQRQSNV